MSPEDIKDKIAAKEHDPNPRRFYIYVHKRATTGEPFYYGKGTGNRAWLHWRNKWHDNVRNKHGLIVEILYDNLLESEAKEMEVKCIAEARERGENITNMTDGGDGVRGWKHAVKHGYWLLENKLGIHQPGICRKGGIACFQQKKGVHARTREQMQEAGRKSFITNYKNKTSIFAPGVAYRNGKACYEAKKGVHGFTKEQFSEIGKKNYAAGIGLASISTERRREIGLAAVKNGTGIHAMTREERSELVKRTNARIQFVCLECGLKANAGNIVNHQTAKGHSGKYRLGLCDD